MASLPLLEMKHRRRVQKPDADALSSKQRLENGNRICRLGAHRVVGISIGVSDDATAIDHESCRHRQLPCRLPVALLEVVLEHIEIDVFQVVRQRKGKAVGPGNTETMIVDDGERETL